jgi:hypothetical protein
LIGWSQSGAEPQRALAAFKERLASLGWVEGRNLNVDVRWSAIDSGRASLLARELVAFSTLTPTDSKMARSKVSRLCGSTSRSGRHW